MIGQPLLLLGIMTVINLIYNAFLPLHPDEAYYWVWAQNLQLSYFDHPPMVAYAIKIATLFSQSEWCIRLVAVFSITLSSWLVYRLAAKMFSQQTAYCALVVFQFLPLTQVGYQVVTPDSTLMLFWTSTVYFAHKAIFEHDNGAYYAAGITAGFMLLSKYTGVLLFPGIFLFLLTTRYRKVLLQKHIYGAIILTLLVFSPVLLWNWQNDWISFKFQFSHGAAEQKIFNLRSLGNFLGGQAGVANPFFFLAMLFYFGKNLKRNMTDEKLAFLFWPFFFVLAFFTYTSMFKKAELNWPAPAYITGAILLGYWLQTKKNKWIPAAGIVLTIFLLILARFPEAFPFLPEKAVLKDRYYGFRELYNASGKYIPDKRTIVLSDTYQNASMAWYYIDGNPEVHILTSTRFSNYNYWKAKLADKPVDKAIYVGDPNKLDELKQLFGRVEVLDTLNYEYRHVNRSFGVYLCENFLYPQSLTVINNNR